MSNWNDLKKEIIDKNLCCLCGTCMGVCPTGTIDFSEGKIDNVKNKCVECGKCLKACNYRLYSDKPDEYDISVISSVSSDPGEPDVIGTQNYHTEYTNHSSDGISISNK